MRMYVDPKVLEEIGSENAVIVANHHYGLFHYIRRWLKTKKQNFLIVFVLLCGLSAKDRGATENPVSDLELNLSKTATKVIKFY